MLNSAVLCRTFLHVTSTSWIKHTIAPTDQINTVRIYLVAKTEDMENVKGSGEESLWYRQSLMRLCGFSAVSCTRLVWSDVTIQATNWPLISSQLGVRRKCRDCPKCTELLGQPHTQALLKLDSDRHCYTYWQAIDGGGGVEKLDQTPHIVLDAQFL